MLARYKKIPAGRISAAWEVVEKYRTKAPVDIRVHQYFLIDGNLYGMSGRVGSLGKLSRRDNFPYGDRTRAALNYGRNKTRGSLYLFLDNDEYVRLSLSSMKGMNWTVDAGYPKKMREGWNFGRFNHKRITAGLNWFAGKSAKKYVYFFMDDGHYIKYDWTDNRVVHSGLTEEDWNAPSRSR